jgi:ribosomal-protein-alanine N-acetyltransferase
VNRITMPISSLHTERLELRPFTLDDAEAYCPLVANDAVLRFTGEQPCTRLSEVEQILLTRPLRDYERYGYGRLACIERTSSKLIGFCGLKYLEDLQETDIGYRFLPEFWGKGYATESARAVINQGRRLLGIQRIIGLVEAENHASSQVLRKLGLSFESEIHLADHPKPLQVYASER